MSMYRKSQALQYYLSCVAEGIVIENKDIVDSGSLWAFHVNTNGEQSDEEDEEVRNLSAALWSLWPAWIPIESDRDRLHCSPLFATT